MFNLSHKDLRIAGRIGQPARRRIGAQQAVGPEGHIPGRGVAVLVDEAPVVDRKADVKHHFQNPVDPVLPEQPRLPAIDLHQITAGLGAVLVIAMKRGERRQMIGPDVGKDRIASDVVIAPSVRAARRGRQSGSGYSRNGSCWRGPCWRRSTSPGSRSQEDFARFDDLFAAYC